MSHLFLKKQPAKIADHAFLEAPFYGAWFPKGKGILKNALNS